MADKDKDKVAVLDDLRSDDDFLDCCERRVLDMALVEPSQKAIVVTLDRVTNKVVVSLHGAVTNMEAAYMIKILAERIKAE